jgi:hypothetical protein
MIISTKRTIDDISKVLERVKMIDGIPTLSLEDLKQLNMLTGSGARADVVNINGKEYYIRKG